MATWERQPRGALAAYVETLWASRREALPHRLEWLLPSGCADLVIPLHDHALLRMPAGRIERLRGGVFQGASDAALLRATGGAADVVGVHFKPGGAAALLGGAAIEASGRSVALADFPGNWQGLRERLLAEPAPPRRLALLEAFMAQLATRAAPDPMIARVLQALHGMSEPVRITELRELTGLGPTRFIARFQASVGLTPKRYARVLRFNRALEQLAQPRAPALAQIALLAGYADQSHFTNEFRRLTGVSPSRHRPASQCELRHLPVRKNLQARTDAGV
jgi:AraC-like DNA-binding protein